MSELVATHSLTPEVVAARTASDREQIYNALDCCVTFEVKEELSHLTNAVPIVYDFERALQAPILDMMLRGVLVDQYERQKLLATCGRLCGDSAE